MRAPHAVGYPEEHCCADHKTSPAVTQISLFWIRILYSSIVGTLYIIMYLGLIYIVHILGRSVGGKYPENILLVSRRDRILLYLVTVCQQYLSEKLEDVHVGGETSCMMNEEDLPHKKGKTLLFCMIIQKGIALAITIRGCSFSCISQCHNARTLSVVCHRHDCVEQSQVLLELIRSSSSIKGRGK